MFQLKKILLITSLFLQLCLATGNQNNFELGTAIYRELSDFSEFWSGHHWHGGVYLYFEYSNNYGYMRYSENNGYFDQLHVITEPHYINDNISELSNLKTNFKNKFREGDREYKGAYNNPNYLPNTLSLVAGTAMEIGNWNDNHSQDIGYTWVDILDINNIWQWWPPGWYEHWNGKISRIDELRCDGVIEYSYEKNGILVSNDKNIGESGKSNVYAHNEWHDGWADIYGTGAELCPRFQAGDAPSQSHPKYDYINNNSQFSPLISSPPTTTNFSRSQYSDMIQLNFKVSDNASVKSYVLIQVKKSSETTWRILKDQNNNLWKFKSVDLTDYANNLQYDYFYIPWAGSYEGGGYYGQTSSFNLKITVIDQGANYSETLFNFSGTIPALEVAISGPSILYGSSNLNSGMQVMAPPSSATGTWTANATGGNGGYSYQWYMNGYLQSGATSKNFTKTISSSKTFMCIVTSDGITGSASKYVQFIAGGGEPFALENHPNPFNPETTIKINLPSSNDIKLVVYNILGEKIITLHDGMLESGEHKIKWKGQNNRGQQVASGIYFYSLELGNKRYLKKMIFAK